MTGHRGNQQVAEQWPGIVDDGPQTHDRCFCPGADEELADNPEELVAFVVRKSSRFASWNSPVLVDGGWLGGLAFL